MCSQKASRQLKSRYPRSEDSTRQETDVAPKKEDRERTFKEERDSRSIHSCRGGREKRLSCKGLPKTFCPMCGQL